MFFIGLIYISITYIYPNVLEIEQNKKILVQKNTINNELKSKWFNFERFRALEIEHSLSEYKNLKELLNNNFYKKISKSIDENTYNQFIYRENFNDFQYSWNFFNFLEKNLNEKLESLNSKEFNSKIENIDKVLPLYSDFIEIDWDKWLTNLKFINHIENILKKYNLKTNSSIGIKNILPVKNLYFTSTSNIYYIPLELNINWTKLSILKFLEYIQNTWRIKNINSDGFTFSDKVWAKSQLAMVTYLKLDDHIDSSYRARGVWDKTLIEFIYNTKQINDIINIKLKIEFYINVISSEDIKIKINQIIWDRNKRTLFDKDWNTIKDKITWKPKYELRIYNYNNIFNKVRILKSNTLLNKNTFYNNKVTNMFRYLNNQDLKKDMLNLRKESREEKINSVYKQALKYKQIFINLNREMDSIIKSLGIEK